MSFLIALLFLLLFGFLPLLEKILGGKQLYRIKSSILKTCTIQLIVLFWTVILIIALLKSIKYDYTLKYQLIAAIIVLILICINIVYNYIKIGEGIFEDGVIYRGVFRNWENCKGYQIDFYDKVNTTITIYFQARTINFQIQSVDIGKVENIFNEHSIHKIDIHK